jgi:hypothetical protein
MGRLIFITISIVVLCALLSMEDYGIAILYGIVSLYLLSVI